MGGHRELCLVGMHGKPLDSWVEVQRLVECTRAKMWGAILGLGAVLHCGTQQLVVLGYKLLMTLAAVVLSLQQGSRDWLGGCEVVCSWKWVAPLVGDLCCTAMSEPWVAAAGGSDSSYLMTQQEGEAWPVQGAVQDRGLG